MIRFVQITGYAVYFYSIAQGCIFNIVISHNRVLNWTGKLNEKIQKTDNHIN